MGVSVVIPTRNRTALLAMTLRSVLRQRDVTLEVIVVDEAASTDDTGARLAAIRDPRLRVIHHDAPRGLPAARNHGAEEARGEWLAFIDDDDLWAPDKIGAILATKMNRLRKSPPDRCGVHNAWSETAAAWLQEFEDPLSSPREARIG